MSVVAICLAACRAPGMWTMTSPDPFQIIHILPSRKILLLKRYLTWSSLSWFPTPSPLVLKDELEICIYGSPT